MLCVHCFGFFEGMFCFCSLFALSITESRCKVLPEKCIEQKDSTSQCPWVVTQDYKINFSKHVLDKIKTNVFNLYNIVYYHM